MMIAVTGLANAADDHHVGMRSVGRPGEASRVDRTIQVEMNDSMRFIPSEIEVRKGDTIRFVVANAGQVDHEFMLGNAATIREHARHMKKSPGMRHSSAHHVTVPPGKTAEVIWQFSKAGTIDFACLVPGHFEAGMRGTIVVK